MVGGDAEYIVPICVFRSVMICRRSLNEQVYLGGRLVSSAVHVVHTLLSLFLEPGCSGLSALWVTDLISHCAWHNEAPFCSGSLGATAVQIFNDKTCLSLAKNLATSLSRHY